MEPFRILRDLLLEESGSSLTIIQTRSFSTFVNFSALDSITAQLNIHDNTKLMNVDGLSSLRSAGSLFVGDNHSLTSVKGLMSIAST